MISFKTHLAEAEVNSHMTHLSELVFTGGVAGTKKAFDYLRDMRNMFGYSHSNTYTVKFDGAPAVIMGIDPTDGELFVAKKSIFNKTPKVYKTQADIAADLSGELAEKFSILLKHAPSLGIKSGIYQGDLMYTKSDLTHQTIDGVDMITFHPNTIVYAVPFESDLATRIKQSELGIVFHTTYTGSSFDTLKASFGKNITTKFQPSRSIWAMDATIDNKTKQFTLDIQDWTYTELLIKDLASKFRFMNPALLNGMAADETIRTNVLIFINSLVRANVKNMNPRVMSEKFYQFIHDRFQKEIDLRKSEAGKNLLVLKRRTALTFFDSFDHADIATVFEIAQDMEALKDILLSKMKKVAGIEHFLKTKEGFKVTNPEGFVAINSATGEAVKLVDRFEFSMANFNPEFIKGFQKPAR